MEDGYSALGHSQHTGQTWDLTWEMRLRKPNGNELDLMMCLCDSFGFSRDQEKTWAQCFSCKQMDNLAEVAIRLLTKDPVTPT